MATAPEYSEGIDPERASRLGYTHVDGPHPFGTSLHLPAPFDLDLDTSGL
ncbi:hypothetical protein [Streptomyces sp. NPDC059881]